MDKTNCFGGFGAYDYLSILIEDKSLFCDENKEAFRQVLLQELGNFRFVMNETNDITSFAQLRQGFSRLEIGKSSEGFYIYRCGKQLTLNAKDITEIVKAKMRIKMKQKTSLINKGKQQADDLIIISMNNIKTPSAERQREYIGKDILCTRDYLLFNDTTDIRLLQRNKTDRWAYDKERFNYIYDTTTDTCLLGDIKDVPSFYRSGNYLALLDENGNIWCVLKEKGSSSLYPSFKENKGEDIKCNPTSLEFYLDSILGKRKEERDKAYQEILTKINHQQ